MVPVAIPREPREPRKPVMTNILTKSESGSQYSPFPHHESEIFTDNNDKLFNKWSKFLKKLWCCIGGGVLQDKLILSIKLMI